MVKSVKPKESIKEAMNMRVSAARTGRSLNMGKGYSGQVWEQNEVRVGVQAIGAVKRCNMHRGQRLT